MYFFNTAAFGRNFFKRWLAIARYNEQPVVCPPACTLNPPQSKKANPKIGLSA
jgi:hypothetical protein